MLPGPALLRATRASAVYMCSANVEVDHRSEFPEELFLFLDYSQPV